MNTPGFLARHVHRLITRPIIGRINELEITMSLTEAQTRADLVAAVTGTLAAYDAQRDALAAVTAERDQLRAALESANADKAAAVEAANIANDEGDAQFNASQVERLRELVPAEPGPADES